MVDKTADRLGTGKILDFFGFFQKMDTELHGFTQFLRIFKKNPKFEARNPKQYKISGIQMFKTVVKVVKFCARVRIFAQVLKIGISLGDFFVDFSY